MRTTQLTSLAAASALLCAACSNPQGATETKLEATDYHVVGTVADTTLEGSTLYLSELYNSTPCDSAVVKEGAFELTGSGTTPNIYSITLGEESHILTSGSVATVTVDGKIAVAQGNETQVIAETAKQLFDEQEAARADYYALRGDMEAQRERLNRFYAFSDSLCDLRIDQNSDNLIGAYFVARQVSDTETLAELDSLVARAPLAENLYSVKKNRYSKEQKLKTAEGAMFVDFDGTNLDGTSASLSDYVGKGNYVLVDFWASWCGPCRAEMPNLRKVYEKHQANGLVLLGVNVWDDREACEEAMDEEQMSWPILYASHNNDATDSYGIVGIPTIILFAPDGTIVNRTARGAEIMKLVDGVYGK